MDFKELKSYLRNNPKKIEDILYSVGCHKIKIVKNKRIMSARPNGNNPTSVQVLLTDEKLISIIHTDSDYDGGDIYNLIAHIRGGESKDSFIYICNLLKIEYNFKRKSNGSSKSYELLKSFLDYSYAIKDYKPKTLKDLDMIGFIKKPHVNFLKEGISTETQMKFEVMYDLEDSRICFPIKDQDGNIVSVKGRTTNKEYKTLGIPKYIYYYPLENRHFLYGLYENYFEIISSGEIIIYESEKSVQKSDSVGINNCVSIGTKKITDEQLEKILSLKVDVILAFDKDVTRSEVEKEAEKFGKFANVYAIFDQLNKLSEKDSPIEKGVRVFQQLYEKKIKLN